MADIKKRIVLRKQVLNETIALSAISLKPGEQTRAILCPSCSGGGTNEKSFSLRKEEDRILYRCWRSSCDVKGIIGHNGSLIEEHSAQEPIRDKPLRKYEKPLVQITKNGLDLFQEKFGMTNEDLLEGNVLWNKEEDRYVFPVWSPHYSRRGLTIRTFNEGTIHPKWDAYPLFQQIPWLGWFVRSKITWAGKPVVVVEDPISALKISRQFKVAFLNGTNLDLEKLLEIGKVAGQAGVIIALDKDATEKSIKLLRQYAFFIGNSGTCAHLEVDAKYMSDHEILAAFTRAK